MGKKFVGLLALGLSGVLGTPAGAGTVTSTFSTLTNPAFATTVDFDSCCSAAPTSGDPSITSNVPGTISGATFSGGGIIMNNPAGPTNGMYAEPAFDTSNYLAVVGSPTGTPASGTPLSAPETISLNGVFNQFGLYWGSMDSYNKISFYSGGTGGTLVSSFTGSNFATPDANGDQAGSGTNKFVQFLFTDDTVIDTVVLDSSPAGGNSFEVDNLSWSLVPPDVNGTAPLPAALPLFLSGLGGLGFLGYRRKRKKAAA